MISKPLVLHLPGSKEDSHLYSDNSKFAIGKHFVSNSKWKTQINSMQVKDYPKTARSYSITELEMCGLAINIASFVHIFKKVDFNAILDHLALTHIFKSKAELTTTRIKRLLEILSSYSFNLYCIKGKRHST